MDELMEKGKWIGGCMDGLNDVKLVEWTVLSIHGWTGRWRTESL